MNGTASAPWTSRAAILVVACAVLVLQIATTRVLSATISHHMAFAVIALVMLGLATSATAVFVQRNRPTNPARMPSATNALLVGGGVCALTAFGYVGLSWLPVGAFASTVVVGALMFFAMFWCAGYGVAFILAEYPEDVGRVYWFDLTGAALGCLLVVPLIDSMPALVVILWCGVMVALGGLLLAKDPADGRQGLAGGVVGALLLLTLAATFVPALTTLGSAKGIAQDDVLWERWNRLARVTVSEDIPGYEHNVALLQSRKPDIDARAVVDRWRIGWGMSPKFDGDVPDIRWIMLDTDAGTQIIQGGATDYGERLDYLEYDVTAIAYHLRRDALGEVFVIGGGGGRDPLTALHFGAESVDVVELNPGVVHAVNDEFREFSGGVYSLPQLHVTIGEARSVLSRRDKTYDLLQMSMIDTWASSVAGALVLSENALYTAEAFSLYVGHLAPDGIATVSRWAGDDMWGELARTVALMGQALEEHGVTDLGAHLAVVQTGGRNGPGVATCLMKRSPFTEEERELLYKTAGRLKFRLLYNGPGRELRAPFDVEGVLAQEPDVIGSVPYDLSPPTDDRPFFFNVRPIFMSWIYAAQTGDFRLGSPSTLITGTLMLLLLLVGRVLAIAPLERHNAALPEADRTTLRDHLWPLLYFAGIGVGFLLVEIAILQRYMIFLGHPTYAMSVVLFSLLLASGLGSSLTVRFRDPSRVVLPIGLLLAGVLFTAFVVPPLLRSVHGWDLSLRIVLAAALVAPLGLCMGMFYPLGVRLLTRDGIDHLIPWVWSINGIAGVFASVFGIMVAMSQGYTVALLLGGAAYVVVAIVSQRSWRVGAA